MDSILRLSLGDNVAAGAGWARLPDALDRKYPNAAREWPWQWVFPATRSYVDPVTGRVRRHHLHETVLQRIVREAVLAAGLSKRASCHTLKPSFSAHLLEGGYDIRTSHELLGQGATVPGRSGRRFWGSGLLR